MAKEAPRNAHAARDALADVGFTVADGRFKALPVDFCIVGGSGPKDLPAVHLLKLYSDDTPDHRRARGIILGARDRLRVAKPPPPEFIASCRNGLTQDVGVADLRVGTDGVRRVVVLVGRQRIMARRIIDAEGAKSKPPAPPLAVFCVAQTFPRDKDFDTEMAALKANCRSNCFVAEPPSVLADKAAMLAAKGMGSGDIAVEIGASGGASHVDMLVDLSKCETCVWDAVDANRLPLAYASVLCKLPPEEQAQRVARKLAGNGKAAKDAAAPPRAKTRPAPVLKSLADALRTSVAGLPSREMEAPVIQRRLAWAEAFEAATGGEMPEEMKAFVEIASTERAAKKGKNT